MVNCIAWRVRPKLVLPLGIGLTIAAFVLYCLTMSTGVYPGESAKTIASVVGLDMPKWAPARPLFQLLTHAIASFVPTHFPIVLNLFSAVCTAISTGLFYFLTLQWLLMCSREDEVGDLRFDEDSAQPIREDSGVVRHNQRSITAAVCGATIAGFLFATSVPLWCMGTRLYVDPFVVMLLLAVLNYTLSTVEVLNTRDASAALFLLTLCCFESVIFWVATPIVFLAIGREILLAQQNDDEHPPLWSMATPLILGTSLAVCAIWAANSCCWGMPLSQLPIQLLRRYGEELASWMPHGCWVEMLVQGSVPLALTLIFSFTAFRRRNWWFFLYQAGLLACVMPSLFNLPFCFGRRLRLVNAAMGIDTVSVLDGIVPAIVVGVVVASWMLLRDPISYRTFDEPDYEGQSDHRSLGVAGTVMAWFVLLVSIGSLLWRWGVASGRSGSYVDRLAGDTLALIEPGSIIFGDSLLRDNMRLMALREGRDVRFAPIVNPLDLTVQQQLQQTQSLATNMPTIARAYYGVSRDAFLSSWLLLQPELSDRIVLLDDFSPVDFSLAHPRRQANRAESIFPNADLGRVTVVPQGLISKLSVKSRLSAPDALSMERDKLSMALLELADEIEESGTSYLRQQKRILCRDLAKRLNSLSVNCLTADRATAAEGFMLAQELDPVNPAILLNRYTVKGSTALTDREIAIISHEIWQADKSFSRFTARWGRVISEAMFEAFVDHPNTRPTPEEAETIFRKRRLQEAGWQVVNLNFVEAEQLARWLMDQGLKDDPKVWVCLALSLAGQQQVQGAKLWIDRASKKGFSEKDLATIQAFLDYCVGDYAQARRQLERVIKVNAGAAHYIGLRARPTVLQLLDEQSEELQALALMADVLFAQNRQPEVGALVLPMMWDATRRNTHPIISRVQGDLAFRKGEYLVARECYRMVLAATPSHRHALSYLLEVDRRLGDVTQAGIDARCTLANQPLSYEALALLGYAYDKSGQRAMAVDILKLSDQIRPNADAEVDLARIALEERNLPHAKELLNRAITVEPKNDRAWAELAKANLQEQSLDEALTAIDRAINLREDVVPYRLTKAWIFIAKNQPDEAATVVFPYMATRAHETREVQEEFEAVLTAIRGRK